MNQFSKDVHSEEPLDQNLYFAQNMPKRKSSQSNLTKHEDSNQKKVREFKTLFLVIKWILLMVLYPFFFVFKTVPAFVEKMLIKVFKKLNAYADRLKAYLYQKIGVPLIRCKKKIEEFMKPYLQACYDGYNKALNYISRIIRAYYKKVADQVGEIRQLFSK